MGPPRASATYHFGPYALDVPARRLLRQSERVPLRPRALEVLEHLLAHRGTCVSREQLLREIWGDAPVCESNLSTCIAELRAALGDAAGTPRFIATIHRRGYRFIAEVESRGPGDTQDSGAPAGLIGREVAWRQLVAAAAKAREGQASIVLLSGEAGIGKTALVNAFVPSLTGDPAVVVARGQCLAGEIGNEPFFAIADAINSLAAAGHDPLVEIARRHCPELLFASGLSIDEPSGRRVVRAIEAMAQEHLLVLVIEDLQYADPSTIDVLSALAWRRDAPRFLLVGSARLDSDPRSRHPLMQVRAEMLARGMIREISLTPWSVDEVGVFLRSRGEAESVADDASHLHVRSGGNPLVLTLLLDHAGATDRWRDEAFEVRPEAPALPPRLRAFVETEVAALSATARPVVDVLSVAGRRVTSRLLAAVLDREEESVEQTCWTLVHRGMLQGAPDGEAGGPAATGGFAFRHHVYGEVIGAALSVSSRQQFVQRLRRFGAFDEPSGGSRRSEGEFGSAAAASDAGAQPSQPSTECVS